MVLTLYPEYLFSQINYSSTPFVIILIRFSSVQLLSRVRLFVTPWTAAYQASLSYHQLPHFCMNKGYVYVNFFRAL